MSLYQRILSAFMLVILLTVLISIGVGYWTTQQRLREFTSEISLNEATNLANTLSQEYTFTDGWTTLDNALFFSGYYFDEALVPETFMVEIVDGTPVAIAGSTAVEPAARVVVVSADETVLFDTSSELDVGNMANNISGQRASILDLRTNEPVGYVSVDWDNVFLREESATFLADTLRTIGVGGLLTAGIALLIAAWLSKRISAPITALTAATQSLTAQGEVQLLPVESNDELGQMSAAFNQLTSALQKQRALRKRLIDDVSHELNTPLSVIQLEASGLLDNMQSPTESAQQIIQEVDMLRNLVHDLNWLAETDSGELRLKTETILLGDILSTEVDRWQTQAAARGVQLTLQPSPQHTLIEADKLRMSQALGNVVANALQHSESGGSVSVTTELTSDSTVIIGIKDEGVGINSADLPHIFDRLYRADQSRNRRTGGRGLGLPIAQAIIEGHAGTISARSGGQRQGTTISIQLPLYSAPVTDTN